MTHVSIVFERVVVCRETEYPMRGAATAEGEEQQEQLSRSQSVSFLRVLSIEKLQP